MKRRRMTLCLLLLSPGLGRAEELSSEDVLGRWTLAHTKPGVVETETVQLLVRASEGIRVTAEVSIPGVVVPFEGTFDPTTGLLALVAHKGGKTATIDLVLEGAELRGEGKLPIGDLTFVGTRLVSEPTPMRVIEIGDDPPRSSMTGALPPKLAAQCAKEIDAAVASKSIVGISVALVIDFEVAEVLSVGWADFEEQVPASESTMYRWASVTKPLTAITALQLADAGVLDLEADVREWVPEYDKEVKITAEQLLAHEAGIPHYDELEVRSPKQYVSDHPWADRVTSLDMFVESDLLFSPGYAYRYSTPGYVLLGAVIDRAAPGSYAEQVIDRICEPLEMTTMRPDYLWEEIPGRAAAYQSTHSGAVRGQSDDISWKLPAGGWISTAGDMGRFATGLMGNDLLEPATRERMCELRTDYGDGIKGYGLGVQVGRFDGWPVLMHGGGQVGASTYLACSPDTGHAVAILVNTEGAGVSDLAFGLLDLLIDS